MNANRKQRRQRMFQPEMLERRELLSTLGLPGHQPADVVPLANVRKEVISGTMTGRDSVSESTISKGTVSFSATGTLTTLGASSLSGSETYVESKSQAIKYSKGSAIFTDESFNTIDGSFTGSGKELGSGIVTFKFKGKVTGGTGPYAGAAGKISAAGTSDMDAFSIKVTITLKRL